MVGSGVNRLATLCPQEPGWHGCPVHRPLFISLIGSIPTVPHGDPLPRRCESSVLLCIIGFRARQSNNPWCNSAGGAPVSGRALTCWLRRCASEIRGQYTNYPQRLNLAHCEEVTGLRPWEFRIHVTPYSHSIVAGGFPEISYVTRETPLISLMMRRDTWSRNSYGKCAQRAVMKSMVSTARSATT